MLAMLAFRNLWRRPLRTALSLFGIAFAAALLVFMLSFQLGVYESMKANALRLFDGFAQIQPASYANDPDLRKSIVSAQTIGAEAVATRGVTAAAPRAETYALLANGDLSFGAAIVGVDPGAETKVSSLHATIARGRYLSAGDDAAIVLGDALARDLNAEVGDSIALLGSAADGSLAADRFKIVGIFHTGIPGLDRQIAEIPLSHFRSTFALGDNANIIAVTGASLGAVDAALPQLEKLAAAHGLVVRDWSQLQPSLAQAITLDMSTAMLWYVSLVVVVVFIILNTLMMSVLERTQEFGVLLAIGMRPDTLGRLVWIELLLLAAGGAAAGALIGGVAALWLEARGVVFGQLQGLLAQWGLPGRLYPRLSPLSLLAGPLAIVASIAAAGIVPYLRVLRLNVRSALAAP